MTDRGEDRSRYRSFFETIDQGACILEILFDEDEEPCDYLFVEVNPSFEGHTGLHQAEGKTALEMIPELSPFWIETYGRVATTGEATRFENFEPTMDRWFEVQAFPIEESHKHRVALLFNDITAQKTLESRSEEALYRSQERLRRAFMAAKMVAWEWDDEKEQLVTFPDPRETEGLPFRLGGEDILSGYQLIHPDDRDRHREIQSEALRNHQSYVSVYRVRHHKEDEWVWVEDSAQAVDTDEGGNYLLGVVRDITARKLAEDALLEADRRKDHFLAILSHELRNPLASIRMSLDLLQYVEPGSQEDLEAREIIERQSNQLTRLVDDLLDVTRITRDKIRLQRQRIDLRDVTTDTVEDHRALFEDKEIELRLVSGEEPVCVDGDPNRLAQVIGNLLQNAVKFTDPGGITEVQVEADLISQSAQIRVIDNGVGIDEESLSTLFEPFSQGDASLDRAGSGLGLGLALVEGLIGLHDGQVAATSDGIGEGSTFTVRLPLSVDEESTVSSESSEVKSDSLRILVIEDNPDVAQTLSIILKVKGHQVSLAPDGLEGLRVAAAEHPDAVVCDIGLPGLDGFGVARAMREDDELKSIPLIALSGYATPEDVQEAKAAGFDHHLAKPPDMDKLLELLSGDR